jgi:hypothetical protein
LTIIAASAVSSATKPTQTSGDSVGGIGVGSAASATAIVTLGAAYGARQSNTTVSSG